MERRDVGFPARIIKVLKWSGKSGPTSRWSDISVVRHIGSNSRSNLGKVGFIS